MEILNIIRKKKIDKLLNTSTLSTNEKEFINFLDEIFENLQYDIDVYWGDIFIYRYYSDDKKVGIGGYIWEKMILYTSANNINKTLNIYFKYRLGIILSR